MSADDRLYRLLPAILRQRDHGQGEPLRALMRIFAVELRTLELETETVYDDWFIETCSEWLVPYIGEALGVRGLRPLTATGFSTRAFVANLLDHRRRKGTASELEQLGRDLTQHGSVVTEAFTRLVVTPHLQHVRQGAKAAAIRNPGPLEHLGGPFGDDARTPDIRAIERTRSMRPADLEHGLWNVPNVALHLFTLQSRPIVRAEARPIAGEPGWYRFDPLGRDTVLFSRPYPEDDITALAGPEHVARALSRLELAQEERGEVPMRWLGPNAVIRVRTLDEDDNEVLFTAAEDLVVDTDGDDIPDAPQPLVTVGSDDLPRLRIAHLADLRAGGLPTRRPRDPQIVHVDPENGRLVFHPDAPNPAAVLVDYAIGHASPIGAGPWDRTASFAAQLQSEGIVLEDVDAQWGVARQGADGTEVFATLGEAIEAWNAFVAAEGPEVTGVIAVMDSRHHARTNAADVPVDIELPMGSRLIIVAGAWPRIDVDGVPTRMPGMVDPNNLRPTILGELTVGTDPTVPSTATRSGGLWLNGLVIEDGLRVLPGALERLSVHHCTTAAMSTGLQIESADPSTSNTTLEIDLEASLLGSLQATAPTRTLRATACVVHGRDAALDLPEAHVETQGTTLVGSTACRVLEASDCIFSGRVDTEHTQQGCIRYSFVPSGSHTPRRYRCQPDLALGDLEDPVLRQRVIARVRPVFTALDPALPAYAQLAQACPIEIRRGGEDRLEMGVFFHQQLPWREDNLRTMLRQFLRHGLDAGLRYEN
jgi:hypothetical protein